MSTQELPIVDISNLARPATREAIDAACCDWGAFQIVGHGIAAGAISGAYAQISHYSH